MGELNFNPKLYNELLSNLVPGGDIYTGKLKNGNILIAWGGTDRGWSVMELDWKGACYVAAGLLQDATWTLGDHYDMDSETAGQTVIDYAFEVMKRNVKEMTEEIERREKTKKNGKA